jgi:D-alanine-D-alanine ligase
MAMATEKPNHKTRLGILFGGKSGEHEVSIASASSVIAALNPTDFEMTAIAITKGGKLAGADETRSLLTPVLLERVRICDPMESRAALMGRFFTSRERTCPSPEIIFPLLHGPYGEDGTIQGLLEIAGVPYVGCGVLASAVGMDKVLMKRLFAQAGLPIVPFRVESSRGLEERSESLRRAVEMEFGYPVFSKPANLGSSVGVLKIHNAREFGPAILESARFDRKIVIEKGVDARELECAILGNDDAQASIVGEILPAGEFYDYDAKYVNPESKVQIPAEIEANQADEVRRLALAAFRAIEGSGLARVDFFLERQTGKIWLNEINTMPGFTSISMYPKLWDACGIPFADLIRRLIHFGFERFQEREAWAQEPAACSEADKS